MRWQISSATRPERLSRATALGNRLRSKTRRARQLRSIFLDCEESPGVPISIREESLDARMVLLPSRYEKTVESCGGSVQHGRYGKSHCIEVCFGVIGQLEYCFVTVNLSSDVRLFVFADILPSLK